MNNSWIWKIYLNQCHQLIVHVHLKRYQQYIDVVKQYHEYISMSKVKVLIKDNEVIAGYICLLTNNIVHLTNLSILWGQSSPIHCLFPIFNITKDYTNNKSLFRICCHYPTLYAKKMMKSLLHNKQRLEKQEQFLISHFVYSRLQ